MNKLLQSPKLLLLTFVFMSFSSFSQTFNAKVSSGAHLVILEGFDWSRYNHDSFVVESLDGKIRRVFQTENGRNYNTTSLFVDSINNYFPQGTDVKVSILRPRSYLGYSNAVLAQVAEGPHLVKLNDWSKFQNRDILVEELDGSNQNAFLSNGTTNEINPAAMKVVGLDSKYLQNTWVYVYYKGANIAENGNLTLVNTQNAHNAGNSINFTSFGTTGPGPQIKSGLEMASGNGSKMYLTLGSYYNGKKEELTLKDGKVGINKKEPVSNLNVFVPASSDFIDAMTIDVESFGNHDNLNRSNFFRVRDLGSGDSYVPFVIKGNGNVGIGINPTHKLDVNGTIHTKEVKVDLNGWADFVFKKEYQLPSLESVEKHINEKGHLPSIPSEEEVSNNGLSLGENQKLLLQKIEELTLYAIEQNKQLKIQNQQLKVQAEKIESLEKKMSKQKTK